MSAQRAQIYQMVVDPLQTYTPDHEKGGEKTMPHARVPNAIARDKNLSPQEKALYLLLATYNPCHPSIPRLAEELVVSESTARRLIRSLKEKGYLKVEIQPGTNSKYELLTPVTHDQTTPVTGDTPAMGDQTTPVTHDQTPLSPVTPEKEQVKRTSKKEGERESAHAQSEPPDGVEQTPTGAYRLTPVAHDSEGKGIFGSDAVLFVAKKTYDVPDRYDVPLRAWIEIHRNQLPNQHDLKSLLRLVDECTVEDVTRMIRRMGDQGYLKFDRLKMAMRTGVLQ